MIYAFTFMLMFFLSAIFSVQHATGCWLVLMLIHGIIYQLFGQISQHVPFYAGIGVLFSVLVFQKFTNFNFLLSKLIILLIVLMSISVLLGINQEASIYSIVTYSKSFFLAIMISVIIKSSNDISLMLKYCLFGLFVGSLFALYQHFSGNYAIDSLYIQRVASLRGDPNDTAMLLVTGLSLSMYAMFNCNKYLLKFIYFVILLSLVASIVLTHSRGGFISMVLVFILVFIKKPSAQLCLCVLFVSLLMIFYAPSNYWDRMQTLISGKDLNHGQSLVGRSQLQFAGFAILLNNPVFGVGPGNFGESFASYGQSSSLYIGTKKAPSVAHNMYLEFFVENGVFSGLLLLMIFSYAVYNMLKYDKVVSFQKTTRDFGLGSAFAISLFGLLFSGLFLSQGKNSVLWFIVGIGFSFSSLVKQHLNVVQVRA